MFQHLTIIIPSILEMSVTILFLCVPAFLMEFAANDLDAIKILLSEQLLMNKGKYRKFNIKINKINSHITNLIFDPL